MQSREIPKYKCHKEVWALQIKSIIQRGAADLMFDIRFEDGYEQTTVEGSAWLKAEAGGYYIVYADGYVSYSPAKAFEEGYTLIEK